MRGKLRIGSMLLFTSLIVSLLVAIVGGIGIYGLSTGKRNIINIVSESIPAMLALKGISSSMNAVVRAERALAIREITGAARTNQYGIISKHQEKLKADIEGYNGLRKSDDDEKLWQDFKTVYASWNDSDTQIVSQSMEKDKLISSGVSPKDSSVENIEAEVRDFILMSREEFNKAEATLDKLVDKEMARSDAAKNASVKSATISITMVVGMTIMCVIVSLLMGLGLLRLINKEISGVCEQLEGVTSDISNTSQAIGETAETINKATVEQSSNVQNTTKSFTQVQTMLKDTSSQTSDAQKSADEVSRNVEEGRKVIDQLVSSMKDIEGANVQLEEISSIMTDIHSKTKIINDIAFKTQLLSFNASIEAARAGSHGRGFSVVAEEVGNLAAVSGKAANEITSLLEDSKGRVESIIKYTREKVGNGRAVTDSARKVFQFITKNVSEIFSRVKYIDGAAQQQTAEIRHVGTSMTQISDAIEVSKASTKAMMQLAGNLDQGKRNLNGTLATLKGFLLQVKTTARSADF